jgi:hypothetical protein
MITKKLRIIYGIYYNIIIYIKKIIFIIHNNILLFAINICVIFKSFINFYYYIKCYF